MENTYLWELCKGFSQDLNPFKSYN